MNEVGRNGVGDVVNETRPTRYDLCYNLISHFDDILWIIQYSGITHLTYRTSISTLVMWFCG